MSFIRPGRDGIGSFFTTFPATENPISESGVWANNDSVLSGGFYQNVRTTGGNAVPNSISGAGNPPGNPPYDDCVTIYQPGLGLNYVLTGVVYKGTADSGEVELLLHATQGGGVTLLYECIINLDGADGGIVRWDGHNSFTVLTSPGSGFTLPPSTPVTGDVIEAKIIGTVITVRYALAATPTTFSTLSTYDISGDTPKYTTGKPGFGFFKRATVDSGNLDFGWQSLTGASL